MYLEHYGLAEPPYSITPDPRFVYLSERHRDALAHLLFGIGQGGGGGFVQLTGEVGTGKTTLSRLLLEQLPDNARVALVLNPRLNAIELLETICEELHLDIAGRRGSAKALVDALNAYLLDAYAQGLRVVLVVDEAQNLPVDALEQVRLLTNLETDTQKLLQIILIGQPELRVALARPELRQLAQRITARFHLTPLGAAETGGYLRHRYRIAGGQRFPFTDRATQRIHAHAGGVPRLINVIAERALLAGYARDANTIDEDLVDEAAKEALPPVARGDARRRRIGIAIAAIAASTVAAIALAAWWPRRNDTTRPPGDALAIASATSESSARKAANTTAPAAGNAIPGDAIAKLDADALAARIGGAAGQPDAAWQQLLAAWQLPHTPADVEAASACAFVLAPGAYCVRGRARLDRLVALGRPALLRLRSDGRTAWAMLQGADALHARLWLDGSNVDIDRIALDAVWNGEYAAIWRAPEAIAEPVRAGMRGPAVDWIRARVSSEATATVNANGDLFDTTLTGAVFRFQRTHGLAADGVVGPETLFALSAADAAGPRLQRTLE
jgi:general secretion pathway protein A